MIRTTSAALCAAALLISGCGSDDTAEPSDTTAPAASSSEPTVAASTPSATGDTPSASPAPSFTVPATVPIPLGGDDECEDTPDPADYDGEIPTAIRPCELPKQLASATVIDGSGPKAAKGDQVIVNYVGIRAKNGEMFDASYQRGVPFPVELGSGQVIAGWEQGLVGIRTGEVRRLDIPADLAYGDSPPGPPIEPGDPLTFIVTAEVVVKPTTVDDAPLDVQVPESVDATETNVTTLIEGTGAAIAPGNTAVAHLMLVRGDDLTVVFNSWELSDPLQILVEEGQTLPGLVGGLDGAKVGDRLQITMPPDDAFGAEGNQDIDIPADTDVIAVVDIIGRY